MRATLVPPVRELPDACSDDIGNRSAFLVRSGANATVPLNAPITVGFNPEIAGSSAPDVDYRLPCIRGRVALAYGSLGGAAKITKIGRLDVDHVDVTAPDGSISPRQGRYTVTDVSGRVTTLNGEYPTGTGIDVPPGTYKIDVTYFANSGDRKKFTQTVTTP